MDFEQAIKVENLSKSFRKSFYEKEKRALNDISFFVPKNKTTGFVGNNGSGKTTTIKCMLNFIMKDSGHISFFGQSLTNQLKEKIGYLPERPYLYEFYTANEFLKFHASFYSVDLAKNTNIDKVLAKVGLLEAKEKKLRDFSKGMLQRIGLAQALIHNPELLILDEPMSGLDPDGRMMVKDIIKEQKEKNLTIFFSSHLLQDMEELCDHLVVIHKGNIIFCDDKDKFIKEYPSLEEAFRAQKGKLSV